MKAKASKMHDVMEDMEEKQNFSNVESDKKLSMCKKQYRGLLSHNSLLQKRAKNLSLHLGEMLHLQKKQTLLIKQLQWLHRQNGAFHFVTTLRRFNMFPLTFNKQKRQKKHSAC